MTGVSAAAQAQERLDAVLEADAGAAALAPGAGDGGVDCATGAGGWMGWEQSVSQTS